MNYHWYHYVILAASSLYTFGSALWTLRAEKRLRALQREQFVQRTALEYTDRDVQEVQRYLEKSPTLRMKTAPFLTKTQQ